MNSVISQTIRLALSMSLMDRELFVLKVATFLERYRDDPATMEKVAAGLFTYLEEVKNRMDMKDTVSSAVSAANLPGKDEIAELTKAIEKLAAEIQEQNQKTN